MQVIFYLLKGIDPNCQRHVVFVDLLPYDGCLPLAVIEGSRGPPGILGVGGVQGYLTKEVSNGTLGCISVAWTSNQPEREAIKALVEQVVKENILRSLRLGGSNLRGASSVPPMKPQVFVVTQQPLALDETKFTYTKPLSDGTLPLKQTVLSSFASAPDSVQHQLQELVEAHNREFNQSGRPFKDNKRGADDTDEIQEEATAASLEGQAGVPQTMELLLQMFPHAEVVPGPPKLDIILVRNGGTE